MFKDYKRTSLEQIATNFKLNYQRFQYFFSDSPWNYEALNLKRLNLLKRQRTTHFNKDGLLVMDDTGVLKPYAQNTQGVKFQYCPSLKTEALCNVAVASCFVQGSKHIPINLKFYQPEEEFDFGKEDINFKSKLSLAQELVQDALQKNIPFSYVVFDSWYPSLDFLEFLKEKNLRFISEIKSDRLLFFKHPLSKKQLFLSADEWVKLIRKHLWHKVCFIRYKDISLPAYVFTASLKDFTPSVKVVVVFGKFSDEDGKDTHLFITNDLQLSCSKIFSLYSERWGIEKAFRELKDTFYFDHYQLRHKERIMRWWMLVILAWTFTFWIKQNQYLLKMLSLKPNTFSEYKQAIYQLILFVSITNLSKNKSLFYEYLSPIKSTRLKIQLGISNF